ncbi:sugar ABC transporter permease [Aquipuribacter nitratireducens]|uniref:Xylose transport system permease protein XylH n=1 Tax=Aquipuribacter nitratireducens TaxID=650104 RepID=A0ABW0GK56_9MICO
MNALKEAFGAYGARVRSGDIGMLSSVLGIVVLFLLFTIARPGVFNTAFNFGNLLAQSAAVIFIAMGLVFVLLLGEIDLSAGFTAGTGAAVLAVLVTQQGWPPYLAMLVAVLVGTLIGLTLGSIVAFLGIPSFVVTLAAFLALQGVILLVIGSGGTIPVRNSEEVRALMNANMSIAGGWVYLALVVGFFVVMGLLRRRARSRAGLDPGPAATFWAGAVGLLVVLGIVVLVLSGERSPNPAATSIRGVPYILPITTVALIGLSLLLNRTAFGRHVYAVGGNKEAARRAGISVQGITILCFMISSSLAAFGGILLASRLGGVDPGTGGAQTLLFAVAAAVIGGTSLFGGRGFIASAVLGGLVIGIIQNGLPLVTSESGIQFVVTGLVLLLAASVDAISRRRSTSG